ncbi:MAG: hypothetical protein M3Q29_06495 [Chloroflexota bacterium]|nr:hypothetical protein [Chloroflexota bacterium]
MRKEFMVERSGRPFVLYAGLLDEAHAQGLKQIVTKLLQIPSAENGFVAVVQAAVETEKGHFVGIGDASPENVPPLIRQHTIRMAETRAKARALRDAVNVGVMALEELGEDDETVSSTTGTKTSSTSGSNGHTSQQPNPHRVGDEHAQIAWVVETLKAAKTPQEIDAANRRIQERANNKTLHPKAIAKWRELQRQSKEEAAR